MTLPASGALSLSAIQTEFGGANPISLSEYYGGGIYVASSTGIPTSGTIKIGLFYGLSAYPTIGLFYGGGSSGSIVTRISSTGTLVGSETTVGTARTGMGGVTNGYGQGMFYGGRFSTTYYNLVTRISSTGTLVGSETTTSPSTPRQMLAGAGVENNAIGMFYGGTNSAGTPQNKVSRISSVGGVLSADTSVGTSRLNLGGATVGVNGLFHGGYTGLATINTTTRISSTGTLVGSETSVGTAKSDTAGASVGGNGMFYTASSLISTVTRISSTGTLVGSETSVGTVKGAGAGANVGGNGLFHGGYTTSFVLINTTTRISSTGTLVGSETSVGTARAYQAGAGL